MQTYSLPDSDSIQELVDALSAALQVGVSIRTRQGECVARGNPFNGFLYNVIDASPTGRSAYEEFISGLSPSLEQAPSIHPCPLPGLAVAVIPIRVDDALIGNILVEEIRLDNENGKSDISAEDCGNALHRLEIDETAYLTGIRELPLLPYTRLNHIMNLLALLGERFCRLGLSNRSLRSTVSSLENQESLHRQERNVLEELAERDSMTGLYNRRKFEETMAYYARQKERTICLISADANFLKLTNDIFGHEAGDLLLQTIAKYMNDLSKSDWLVARCGGDEFRVLLPDTRLETALDYCRRVARNCRRDKTLTLPLSVALGAAEWNSEKETLQDCFSRADVKMYQNKTALKHELRIPTYIMERLYDRQVLNREVVECTAKITYEFALHLHFTKERAREISLAAQFQDIGMAKLPESFVIRGQSRTEEETTQMHMHVTHGYTMARQFDELYKIADIILCSHESWNGMGYPGNLKGEHIPVEARLLRLTSDYVYRTHPTIRGGYYTPEEAKEKMVEDGGKLYDPHLMLQFLEFLRKH